LWKAADQHLRPAHLSVLKSGGSLTIASIRARFTAHIERELSLTIYTPQIRRKPSPLVMARKTSCLVSTRGCHVHPCESRRIRVEQQLTGQSVLIRRLATSSSLTDSLTAFAPAPATAPVIYKLQSNTSTAA